VFYSVFVTRTPSPPEGQLESEKTKWTVLTQGNCKREIAVDFAQNCIRFGSWARARVFAGKEAGKLVYTVVRDNSPE